MPALSKEELNFVRELVDLGPRFNRRALYGANVTMLDYLTEHGVFMPTWVRLENDTTYVLTPRGRAAIKLGEEQQRGKKLRREAVAYLLRVANEKIEKG